MTGSKPDATKSPPYAPWTTFRGFISALKSTAVPQQIDPSVMPKMSGSAKQQVRGALLFFGLTDQAGMVTQVLRDLVKASDDVEAWKSLWSDTFFDSYTDYNKDIDLDTATLKQLADRFRDLGGVSGSGLRKALRFYLDALAATGSTYSPHFKARGLSAIAGDRRPAKTNGGKKPPANANVSRDSGENQPGVSKPDIGKDDFMIKLPGRDPLVISLPLDISDAEWAYISNQVAGFLTLRKGGKK